MRLWFHSYPVKMKESKAAILHNTLNLSKFVKITVPRIMDLLKLCHTTYFCLMGKYTNKSEEHPWDHYSQNF